MRFVYIAQDRMGRSHVHLMLNTYAHLNLFDSLGSVAALPTI